jgi:hypothetical protein
VAHDLPAQSAVVSTPSQRELDVADPASRVFRVVGPRYHVSLVVPLAQLLLLDRRAIDQLVETDDSELQGYGV